MRCITGALSFVCGLGTREYLMMHHQNSESIAIKIFRAEFPWIPKKIRCFRRLSLWMKNSEAYSEVRSNCLKGKKYLCMLYSHMLTDYTLQKDPSIFDLMLRQRFYLHDNNDNKGR